MEIIEYEVGGILIVKYFLPDWEDRVDPNFDFNRDEFSDNHKKNPYKNDCYAHQLFETPPYDGILVSLAIFEKKISLNHDGKNYQIRGKNNIKDYLKIPKNLNLEVMGDCGAYSYVKENEPPKPFYKVENIANLYQSLGFDYGVSVDHLAVDYIFVKDPVTGKREKKILSTKEKDRRIEITLKNATHFLDVHDKNNYSYHPIGVAQGYDLETYKSSVKSLREMGYDYIAVGGLVQYSTDFILKILKEIETDTKNINIHLFGVLRKDHLDNFESLGVTSFDSASFFRKAWLRSGQNYLSTNGNWYSSIRVPQSSNPRVIKNADLNGFSVEEIKDMENKALKALLDYDKDKIDIDTVLEAVMDYDDLLLRNTDDGNNLQTKYRRTLLDKPWKNCNCPICKDVGISVLIFRGTNRNKRRGFHNLWAFRNMKCNPQNNLISSKNKFKTDKFKTEKKSLCIVPCGSTKIWSKYPNKGPTQADKVYIGSFSKKCQEYAKKFYPDSWCIISAKHGFLFPEDKIPTNYDVSFHDTNSTSITIEELREQAIEKKLYNYEKIIALGGKTYSEIVNDIFTEKIIVKPLDGCKGIGYMMNKLNTLINN